MNTHAATTKTIDWNSVLRATLRESWWLLKALFKLALAIGAIAVAIIVAWIENHDRKGETEESATDLYARSDYGLSNSDYNKLQNSYVSDDE